MHVAWRPKRVNVVGSDTCAPSIQRTLCCASLVTLSTFTAFWQWYVFDNNRKRKNCFVLLTTMLMRTRHNVTLYLHCLLWFSYYFLYWNSTNLKRYCTVWARSHGTLNDIQSWSNIINWHNLSTSWLHVQCVGMCILMRDTHAYMHTYALSLTLLPNCHCTLQCVLRCVNWNWCFASTVWLYGDFSLSRHIDRRHTVQWRKCGALWNFDFKYLHFKMREVWISLKYSKNFDDKIYCEFNEKRKIIC